MRVRQIRSRPMLFVFQRQKVIQRFDVAGDRLVGEPPIRHFPHRHLPLGPVLPDIDLSFDAQREACEAYIKSQAHESRRLTHDDDGAFSGASLDRPALQRLLAEIAVGRIDVIVVYKVDRLTQSLADFIHSAMAIVVRSACSETAA